VAKAAAKYNLQYPEILPETETVLDLEGLFHPFVENAISNDVHFDNQSNLLFISGPNMAGNQHS
jgi:Mismatch repair ATPase (MutS family)